MASDLRIRVGAATATAMITIGATVTDAQVAAANEAAAESENTL